MMNCIRFPILTVRPVLVRSWCVSGKTRYCTIPPEMCALSSNRNTRLSNIRASLLSISIRPLHKALIRPGEGLVIVATLLAARIDRTASLQNSWNDQRQSSGRDYHQRSEEKADCEGKRDSLQVSHSRKSL